MLDAVEQITARIEEAANQSHREVISGLLDVMEARIGEMKISAKQCSYGAVLGGYTTTKISIHHLRRILCDCIGDPGRFMQRLSENERDIRSLRYSLYSNVCGKCTACLSRRKPWPVTTVFKTDMARITATPSPKNPDIKRFPIDFEMRPGLMVLADADAIIANKTLNTSATKQFVADAVRGVVKSRLRDIEILRHRSGRPFW